MALQTQFSTYFTTKIHHSFSPILKVRSEKSSKPSDSVPRNSGVGFGSSKVNTKRKQKGKRRRDSIIRRNPVEKSALVKEQEPVQQEQNQVAYENGFTKREQKGQRERASIIRRNPVEKRALVNEQEPEPEQGAYENAFILAWLGFGSVVLVEGLALAASGSFFFSLSNWKHGPTQGWLTMPRFES